ncbi:hypothetical protein Micbo1qcDRAFT_164116, partial [Microdochium bolleyi]
MGSSEKDRDGESVSPSIMSASVLTDDTHLKERKSRVSKSGDKPPRDKERDRERRERDKDKDKDGDDKEHRRHKSDRPRRHKSRREPTEGGEGEDGASQTSHRRHRTREEKQRDRERKTASMSDLTPESLLGGSRISLPYPSFSKAHSKENVGAASRDDLSAAAPQSSNPLTPDATATDLGDRQRSKSADTTTTTPDAKGSSRNSRPPSPPETDLSGDKRFSKASTLSPKESPSSEADRPRSRTSGVSRSSSKRDDRSKLSAKSRASSQATYVRSSAERRPPPPPPFGVTIVDDEDSTLSD